MQGKKEFQEKVFFYELKLANMVPAYDFYRKVDEILDLDFVHALCHDLYGSEGNPSLDPVVFFKLELIALLEGIQYDRQLLRRASDSLSIRYFLGYNLDEALPWHSTISRTRRRMPAKIYQAVFRYILQRCAEAGLIDGKLQAVDSSYFKANASLRSLTKKQCDALLGAALRYRKAACRKNPEAEAAADAAESKRASKKTKNKGGEPISNQTHISTSDPDSRIVSTPDTPLGLYHKGTIAVDSKCGVTTSVIAPPAEVSDYHLLPAALALTTKNLSQSDLSPQAVVADKLFVKGRTLRWVEEHGLTGYLAAKRQVNTHGQLEADNFQYVPERDLFRCPQGQELIFRRINEQREQRVYRAKPKTCRCCPIRSECTTNQQGRIITVSIYQDYYQRAARRMSTPAGKKALKKRATLPEPIFGFWKQFGGLAKIAPRGRPQAFKKLLMAACATNLKKLLHNGGKAPVNNSLQALTTAFTEILQTIFNFFPVFRTLSVQIGQF